MSGFSKSSSRFFSGFNTDFFHQYSASSQPDPSLITDRHWTDLRTQLDMTYEQFTDRLYSLYPQISAFELFVNYL